MAPLINLSGRRFGSLQILFWDEDKKRWSCQCDCGRITFKLTGALNEGNAKTCGCALRNINMKSHGMSGSPEYRAWDNARSRCYRKVDIKYPLYGGRGIVVCDRWRWSFENFFVDMGPRPDGLTLDRIDSNGNYEPSNCRWASYKTQNRNRPTFNRIVTLNGRKMTVAEAAEQAGIPHATILSRLYAGHAEVIACQDR